MPQSSPSRVFNEKAGLMVTPFPPFDPDGAEAERGRRLRDISIRSIFPSMLTLLAIGAGLTAIRFAVENRVELAITAIILAAFLDGIDGRVARLLKSASRFGAELDSLADFVNFGVAPAMLVYFTLADTLKSVGWISVLIYVICVCLRLARFNVALEQKGRPKWQGAFFVGVPAPAGALTVLAPVYAYLLGLQNSIALDVIATVYTVFIGLLMVSRLPTWSGKDFGRSIPRAHVMPVLIVAVGFVALLFSYPWEVMLAGVAAYLGTIPFAMRDWYRRTAAAARGQDDQPQALPQVVADEDRDKQKDPDQQG
ncbi:MAG: CDP-diacylglycerol--serine O-phosphatidyltransferase [Salaquimonas sp.]|nr:CDP-diacylglycerol--serine O-phosphatidyltransferase [Salaquimonas sp.]